MRLLEVTYPNRNEPVTMSTLSDPKATTPEKEGTGTHPFFCNQKDLDSIGNILKEMVSNGTEYGSW